MKVASKLRSMLLLPPYVWFVVLLLIPFAIIITISFSHYDPLHAPPFRLFNEEVGALTLENFRWILQDNFYLHAYFASFKLASITTLITLLIGYPIALGIVRANERVRTILLLAIVLPSWTSLVIRIYALSTLFSDIGVINNVLTWLGLIKAPIHLLNSEFAVVCGMVYCYLPFMVLPLFIAIDRIDHSVIEASLDLGCTPLTSFFRVVLPLSKSGIIAGALLVFIPSIGEVIIPDLLGGNRILTVGKVIWNEFFLNRDWPIASSVTVVLTITFIIPVIIIQNKFLKSHGEDD